MSEPKPPPPLRFLTVEQTAEFLNVGQPLIRSLLKAGELRGIQIGGRNTWRIGLEDIQSYIDEAYRRTAARIAAGEIDESLPGEDD
ncbi:helix-turn-helix domain-containing protein [Arthrobacter sp. FW306-2-2C-D06B]|uniref:helix-turn-helix domain-containing protein n=1 Tax=Arthrobacter sp. FW306-2-2C-D06B TaxID=2879618 RepID=UPI001F3ED076|nr:helix-turn-helix domain-containing protein [Arthrobacter sp. FW306-2-2C-D06B]UKA56937.1 helix-turn-helix domain-containing protein [Arthrobacter sp. FW306-2-2C-D06B]